VTAGLHHADIGGESEPWLVLICVTILIAMALLLWM